MSILSWDDFEDDSQKPTTPEHKSASLDSQKTVNTQVVSNAEQSSPSMAAAQPVGASANRATNPTDSLARASAALDHLDVAPGLEELEMGAQRVQGRYRSGAGACHPGTSASAGSHTRIVGAAL